MTIARVAAAVLWIGGVLLGSFSERPVVSAPRVVDGFHVLAGDFHVHSFPGDGALPPWTLAREARRHGLDVIALTNHNHMLSWRIARWFAAATPDVLLLPGEEVTTPAYHMTAVGISRTVPWDRSAARVAAAVHAQGGVAIVAHPDSRAAEAIGAAFADVDGIESAHPARHGSGRIARELDDAVVAATRIHPGIAQIGASDFHYLAPIGICRTYVFAREISGAGVVEAIRAGRTVGCDARGETYGDPRLVAQVAGECAAASAASGGVQPHLNRIAMASAWLGALGLTLLGSRRT